MISSLALYDHLERDRKKYYMWTRRRILINNGLDPGKDYHVYAKHPLDILISTDLAKALLIREGTIVAKKLRRYIDEYLETQVVENPRLLTKNVIKIPVSHDLYLCLGRQTVR